LSRRPCTAPHALIGSFASNPFSVALPEMGEKGASEKWLWHFKSHQMRPGRRQAGAKRRSEMTKYRSDPMGIKVKFAGSCTRARVSSVPAREPSTIRRSFALRERESCGYAASRGFQRLRFRRGAGFCSSTPRRCKGLDACGTLEKQKTGAPRTGSIPEHETEMEVRQYL
jgi:hypothetical protein